MEADLTAGRGRDRPRAPRRAGPSPAWERGAGLSLEEAAVMARRGRGPRRRPAFGWPAPPPRSVTSPVSSPAASPIPKSLARLGVSAGTIKDHVSERPAQARRAHPGRAGRRRLQPPPTRPPIRAMFFLPRRRMLSMPNAIRQRNQHRLLNGRRWPARPADLRTGQPADLWFAQVADLTAAGHTVITFDNRGCGRSEAPPRPTW